MLIMDYPRRLRYRDGFDKQVLMKPGEAVKVAFDVGRTSVIFNKGHRIRITIASTGAPLYESNPQTGGPQTIEYPANPVTATNSIHHEKNRASHIIAPLITVK
jgi:predicted acyl esterase